MRSRAIWRVCRVSLLKLFLILPREKMTERRRLRIRKIGERSLLPTHVWVDKREVRVHSSPFRWSWESIYGIWKWCTCTAGWVFLPSSRGERRRERRRKRERKMERLSLSFHRKPHRGIVGRDRWWLKEQKFLCKFLVLCRD